MVSNQTQEAVPSSAPRDLLIQTIEDRPTTVLLRWQPPKQPNGPITGIPLTFSNRTVKFTNGGADKFLPGYIIFYSTDNTKWDREWSIEAVIGDKIDFIVKDLKPSTTYYFKIQARNSKGYGPFSTTVPFKTPQSKYFSIYVRVHARI